MRRISAPFLVGVNYPYGVRSGHKNAIGEWDGARGWGIFFGAIIPQGLKQGGTAPTLRLCWESAPNRNHGTGGDFAQLQYTATFRNATGLRLAILTTIGRWGVGPGTSRVQTRVFAFKHFLSRRVSKGGYHGVETQARRTRYTAG